MWSLLSMIKYVKKKTQRVSNPLPSICHCGTIGSLMMSFSNNALKIKLTGVVSFVFRDDARRLWKAIVTFIQEVIAIHYKSDDDITNDTELQAWIQDMHENGFPVREGDIDHEFPRNLATRDQLVHVLTCVVFTCSCQYAAMTFGLMDVAGFVPNTPSVMRLPPPTKRKETTLKSIMDTLPNKSQTSLQIALMYVLSHFPKNEVSAKH